MLDTDILTKQKSSLSANSCSTNPGIMHGGAYGVIFGKGTTSFRTQSLKLKRLLLRYRYGDGCVALSDCKARVLEVSNCSSIQCHSTRSLVVGPCRQVALADWFVRPKNSFQAGVTRSLNISYLASIPLSKLRTDTGQPDCVTIHQKSDKFCRFYHHHRVGSPSTWPDHGVDTRQDDVEGRSQNLCDL